MRVIHAPVMVALAAQFSFAVPNPPTAATTTFLAQHADRKGLVQRQKLVALYGMPLLESAPRVPENTGATDTFVTGFMEDQANCDAMGVVGVELVFLDQITAPSGRFSTYRYTQVMDGVPVRGSLVTVVVYHVHTPPNTTDKISLINIRLVPHPDAPFPPDTVLASDALATVQAEVAGNPVYDGVESYSTPEKVVAEIDADAIHRVWRISATGFDKSFIFLVDAATGTIVESKNIVLDAHVTGQVSGAASAGSGPLHATSPVENLPLPDLYVSLTGQPDAKASASGNYGFTGLTEGLAVTVSSELRGEWATVTNAPTCPATPECSPVGATDLFESKPVTPSATGVDLLFNDETLPSPFATGQINVYLGVTRAHDWFGGLADTYDNIDQNVLCKANVQVAESGASYLPGSVPPTLVFRIEPSFAKYNSPMVADVSFHEYGHYVLDQRLPGIVDLPLIGYGFHEGFADTFAALLSDDACMADGWSKEKLWEMPCLRHMDAADPDLELFKGCTGSECEVQLFDPRCGEGQNADRGCLGLAMAGAFWDLRGMIGDAAVERLFADFFLITDGVLDQSVLIQVLAADDDDGDVRTPRVGGFANEIIAAFQGIHGWDDPFAPQEIKVDWEGPLDCPPFEGVDYHVNEQVFPPRIVLETTTKCGAQVARWFIGRRDLQTLKPLALGAIEANWDDTLFDVRVEVGTTTATPCTSIDTIDIFPQSFQNTWTSVRTDLLGDLTSYLRVYATTAGLGGRFSGVIAGSVGHVISRAVGEGADEGGILDVGEIRLSSGLVSIPYGSTVRARSFSGPYVLMTTPVDGTLEDKDDLDERLQLNAAVGTTGRILVNGDMRASNVAMTVDGDMAGVLQVAGNVTDKITIDGHIPSTGAIRLDGDLFHVGEIDIEGDMAGGIFADWDADGSGFIFGLVNIGGAFSGDVCDAGMVNSHELPPNFVYSGEHTGRVCPPRTPLKVASLPHSATKNRMISINPRSTNNNPVALKVDLTSMLRCSNDLGKICTLFTAETDCSGGSCVEHPDVTNANSIGSLDTWWVGPPIDPTCKDDFGDPLPGTPTPTCSGSYLVSRIVNSPVVRVWNEPVIHVADCEIVPAATYTIRATEDNVVFLSSETFQTTGKPLGKQFGDLVGPLAGNVFPPPDGMANVNDIIAVVNRFNGSANAPDATWVDLHGYGEGQPINGLINVTDLLNVVLAVSGEIEYGDVGLNTDPGQCPETNCPPSLCVLQGDPIALTISGSDAFLDPEEWLHVDVFTGEADELGAYEVALEVSGGTSGTLVLADILVDDERSDYVFGTDTTIVAKNVAEGRVGVLRESGGMEVVGTKYLGTFVYQPASGASGVFEIALKGEGASFLSDGNAGLLPVTLGSDEVVGVGVDCWETWHCNDNNACTTDACTNYECVFTNATQGTACNDGHFCTATDTCNGSGVCTGTGNPCPPRTHWCNEFQDQCAEYGEGEEQ